MRTVYILLTRTNTYFSKMIHGVTGAPYTHAALALSSDLTRLYSFSRRIASFPLYGGFMREKLHCGVYARNGDSPCILFELPVDDITYGRIEGRVQEMLRNKWHYGYNVLGVLFASFGRAHHGRRRFFCSEFVADALFRAGALEPVNDPALIRPNDFTAMPGLRCVYAGPLKNCTVPPKNTRPEYPVMLTGVAS